MGCANTKAGGAAVAEDGVPEGGDAQQKDVPKVMVDGGETAANGTVVNSNGIEEGTTDEKESACNGDLADSKRTSKVEDGEGSAKNDATTPSGEKTSNCAMNGEEAKMADEEEDVGDDAQADAETQGDAKMESADEKSGENDAAESRESED